MGGKSSPPPPPDYTPIANASKESAQLAYKTSQEQLAWAKDKYAQDTKITDRVVNSALDTQAINSKNAAYDRARYQNTYQPLEDQAAADARDFASDGRQTYEMGRAQSGVAQQFDAQRNAAIQTLEGYGVDPSSARFGTGLLASHVQQGAAQAAAGNQARTQTEAMGRAMRSEAINVGRGYPGQIAATYGTALQAGNQGVNSTLAQTASGANSMGTGVQWNGQGNQALGIWGNTLNMGYQNQIAAYNAQQQQSSGLGSALGLAGGLINGMSSGGVSGLALLAEGGSIPQMGGDQTPGGAIPTSASPTGGAAIDDVPARLTPGEFVLPKDVMSWKGEEWAQKEIEKARMARKGAVAKPQLKMGTHQPATFTSRPGALPMG